MNAHPTCPAHHAHRGQVIRCDLAIGHALQHASTIAPTGAGRELEPVTWRHDRGRRAAEADALRWRRERQAGSPTSLSLAAARLVAALAAVVMLVAFALAGGRST